MEVLNHIEIRDGIAFIRERNLKVKMVARMHLWEDRPVEDVMEHYGLSAAEVHAALAFYYDIHSPSSHFSGRLIGDAFLGSDTGW